MNSLALRRAFFVALLVFVTYMTLTPNPDDTQGELSIARWISALLFGTASFGDKVAHVLAYAALGGAATFAHIRLAGRTIVTLVALAAYGVLLEALQGLGGIRTADAIDALANASGAAVGVGAHRAVQFVRNLSRAA